MRPIIKKALLGMAALLMGSPALAACDLSELPANTGGRTDILVVINDNSPASCEVGVHYALQRGLGRGQIARVRAPVTPHVSWQQTQSLRDQLVKRLVEIAGLRGHAVATCGGSTPYYCQSVLDQVALHAGIRYLVMTKGMPARARTNGEPTSVDGQLRHLLAHFSETPLIGGPNERQRLFVFGDGSGLRPVEPAIDGEYIIGRIDGLTVAAAKALIDRTLALEESGLFGKAYYDGNVWSMAFESPQGRVMDHSSATSLAEYRLLWSATNGNSAAYDFDYRLLGIFNERRPECSAIDSPQIYLRSGASATAGKSPAHCVAQLQLRSERAAIPGSRYPQPADALLYIGEQDGQPAVPGVFGQFLNWRKTSGCTETLCGAGDSACTQASTDAFGEIDTRCVGVANGFMGHNMQSYPMSYFWAWPTGWTPLVSQWSITANELNNTGSGDLPHIAYPWVKADEGYGDSRSVWFGEGAEPLLGEVGGASCFDSRLLNATTPCRGIGTEQQHRLELQQFIVLSGSAEPLRQASNSAPRDYLLSFDVQVRGSDNATISLRPSLQVHPAGNGSAVHDQRAGMETALSTSSVIAITTQNTWHHHQLVLRISPAQMQATGWNGSYDGIGLRIVSTGGSSLFSGQIGFDNISLRELGRPNEELIRNGNFQGGHQNLVTGDHAAAFLSRLNGVGFWGSVGHFGTLGYSFGDALSTFTYFWRGLPLGDAVWHQGDDPNGVFYGDPVYSPIKIRLNPVYTRLTGQPSLRPGDVVQLRASTVNGSATTSTYSTAYCYSSTPSFYACDQNNTWVALPMFGSGGSIDQLIGSFGSQADRAGWYILRLTVQTANAELQRQQSFNDYAFLYYTDLNADFDGDGYSDRLEHCMATHYAIREATPPLFPPGSPCLQDSDGDGVSDLLELLRGSDPDDSQSVNTDASSDYDRDGVSDEQELLIGLSPVHYDQDSDGDGRTNAWEVKAGTDPLDPNSFRVFQIPPAIYNWLWE